MTYSEKLKGRELRGILRSCGVTKYGAEVFYQQQQQQDTPVHVKERAGQPFIHPAMPVEPVFNQLISWFLFPFPNSLLLT